MLEISALSLVNVRMNVRVRQSGLVVDPTSFVVQAAFTLDGSDPESGDWKTADWETDATGNPARYWARCLVGPAGTTTLAVGTYTAWAKITASPEVPVLRCGLMRVV